MATIENGTSTEASVLAAFVHAGYCVLQPFGGTQSFDLAVHLGGCDFLRVQCKMAWQRGEILYFNSRSTDHGRGRLPYDGLAEIFGVACPAVGHDRVFLVAVAEAGGYGVSLRLRPARNNQRIGVRMAADYEFRTWSRTRLVQTLARAPNS